MSVTIDFTCLLRTASAPVRTGPGSSRSVVSKSVSRLRCRDRGKLNTVSWVFVVVEQLSAGWLPGGQRGSAGGVAFPDLGGKGLDGGEGEVRAVAEDGVTRPGKSY